MQIHHLDVSRSGLAKNESPLVLTLLKTQVLRQRQIWKHNETLDKGLCTADIVNDLSK